MPKGTIFQRLDLKLTEEFLDSTLLLRIHIAFHQDIMKASCRHFMSLERFGIDHVGRVGRL